MPPKISLVPAPGVPSETDEDEARPLPPLRLRKTAPAPLAPAQVAVPTPAPSDDVLPVPVAAKKTRKVKLSPTRDGPLLTGSGADLMALLEQKGYQVQAKVLDGAVVRALKVTTVYGEWCALWLDKKLWQTMPVDSHDVVWQSGRAQVGIPEAAKTGYVAAVDPTATGVAIEQGPDLSLLLREGLESVPSETTYRLEGGVGKSIIAYPVLKVSDLLQAPDLAAMSVHANTAALQAYSRRLAEAGAVNALDKLQSIRRLLDTYHKTEAGVLKRLDGTFRQLVDWYDAYQTMEQTPESVVKQAQVASNIRVRQDAMRRLLRASQAWASEKVQTFLLDLETKLEEDLRYVSGVEKAVDYIMTE